MDRLARLSFSDCVSRWMRPMASDSAGKSLLCRMRRSKKSSTGASGAFAAGSDDRPQPGGSVHRAAACRAGPARLTERAPGRVARWRAARRRWTAVQARGKHQIGGLHTLDRAPRVGVVVQPLTTEHFSEHDRRREDVHLRMRRAHRGPPRERCSPACRRCGPAGRWGIGRRRPMRAAMPKSITRARPRASSRMLLGFRSRCTRPAACAATRPSSTPSIKVTDFGRRQLAARPRSRWLSVPPVDVFKDEVRAPALRVGLEDRHDVRDA